MFGHGGHAQELVAHGDPGVSDGGLWGPGEELCKVEAAAESLALGIAILANDDGGVVGLLGGIPHNGTHDGAGIRSPAIDVVDDILGCGTSREVADVECEKGVLGHGGK